jgi:hypothetical protein
MPTKKPAAPKNQLGLFASMDPEIASEKHDEIILWTDWNASGTIAGVFPSWRAGSGQGLQLLSYS